MCQQHLAHEGPFSSVQFSPVQSLSHVRLFVTPWTAACQASLSITNSWSPTKPMSIESVTPSNHLILCHPLLLLPSIFPSIGVFSNESALHIRWPKYWTFSFCISPSNEHSGLITFRMDWLDLLAVQGTLKSLLQHHSSKASILQRSASSQSNSHIYTCFTSIWDECNCAVVWAFFGIASLWDRNENWPFPVLWPLAEFSKFAGILSAALYQHHHLGFEIAQLEFHHLH